MPGHVFVVHSLVEGVQYDAAVVPTSGAFGVRWYWANVLGVTDRKDDTHLDVDHLRPAGWPKAGFGRARNARPGPSRPTWFLDVAVGNSRALTGHLSRVLEDIAGASDVKANQGRSKPLIALNTIGVGGGGFDHVRGQVINEMLMVCGDFVARNDLDVVICCASASDYAAFQHQRRRFKSPSTLDEELQEHGRQLVDLARRGDLALFLGAGVSMPAGLPSWWSLLVKLGEQCGVTDADLRSLESPLDQAELIRKRLAAAHTDLTAAVERELAGITVPSLSHVQLAVLGCREVVTTNFDQLYETAAEAFVADPAERIKVLPFERKKPFQRWILKMHGDIRHPDSLVLSRSQFVDYSSAHGPVGSIVQSLMLTKHLLVVGTSLTDDNFLRLAYEITNYLERNAGFASPKEGTEPLGTVLALKAEPAKQELWKGTLALISASQTPDPDTSGLPPESVAEHWRQVESERARDLSIMLDFIAMHAAPENYLLDQRYAALLSRDEQLVAGQASAALREVRSLAGDAGPTSGWRRIQNLLEELGAASDESHDRVGGGFNTANRTP